MDLISAIGSHWKVVSFIKHWMGDIISQRSSQVDCLWWSLLVWPRRLYSVTEQLQKLKNNKMVLQAKYKNYRFFSPRGDLGLFNVEHRYHIYSQVEKYYICWSTDYM